MSPLLPTLCAVPWALAALAWLRPTRRVQEAVLAGGALLHLVGTAFAWGEEGRASSGLLGADAAGLLILSVTSVVFAACAVYAVAYLRFQRTDHPDRPLRVFVPCLFGALGSWTLACFARHLGLLWVALETSGLSVAPLIYFLRTRSALEATWKYLVLSAVGVAFGLLGTFFTAIASTHRAGVAVSLLWPELVVAGPALSGPWLKASFVLMVVGYGTKVGFAPLHTWKPDTYGEAPAPVSALLAGASPLCFLLGILRFHAILVAAGHGEFARQVLVVMGAVSVGLGAALVVGQRDFKRMLAYSSVEHMGVMALAVGAGGLAVAAMFLHAIGNALAKVVLFLSLGSVHRETGTRLIAGASGTLARRPVTGALLLVGWAAALGLPPFPLFHSELGIVRGMLGGGQTVTAVFLVVALAVSFGGLSAGILGVVFGAPRPGLPAPVRRTSLFALPSVAVVVLLFASGLGFPAALWDAVRRAAAGLGGPP